MKSLTNSEVDLIVRQLQVFVGAQLQEVTHNGKRLSLHLYHQGEIYHLHLILDAICPGLAFEKAMGKLRQKGAGTPVRLFLKANGVGRRLASINRIEKYGRLVEMKFGHEDECILEFRLFPHGMNLSVSQGDKGLHLKKPKALVELDEKLESSEPPPREIEELNQFFLGKKPQSPSSGLSAEEQRQKLIKQEKKKKGRTLDKVTQEMQKLEDQDWQQAGEALKVAGSLQIDSGFKELIDFDQNFSWNLQNCFERAKKNQKKIEGLQQRIAELKDQISQLEQGDIEVSKGKNQNQIDLFKETKAKGRKSHIAEDLHLYVGKSGKDNLALLRKAKAWDIWIHARDFPGSHGIIKRNKNRQLKLEELERAGQFLLENSLGQKSKELQGEKIDLMWAECRYVTPIKGDRLGRVTYKNETSFRVEFARRS